MQSLSYLGDLLSLWSNNKLRGGFIEMSMTKEEKNKIIEEYRLHEGDTGSPEVQIAILTHRINSLTEHLKVHKRIITQEEDYLR